MVGHLLFTRARLEPEVGFPAFILAPLAVLPEHQTAGVGGKLIEAGLTQLTRTGPCLVFVLGHPGYYPRFGFRPAGAQGLHAPYPIPEGHADAWMVQPLGMALPSGYTGTVRCAAALDHIEHWRE